MSQTADPTANKAGCFPHEGGDVGMRDFGATAAEAFIEQVTRSLTAEVSVYATAVVASLQDLCAALRKFRCIGPPIKCH